MLACPAEFICFVTQNNVVNCQNTCKRVLVFYPHAHRYGTGLVGYLLFQQFVARGHPWVLAMELVPGFALYRGLYEIAEYAFKAVYQVGGSAINKVVVGPRRQGARRRAVWDWKFHWG